jgi:hypothetical protein
MCEFRNQRDTSKPIDLVRLWFRSPHNGVPANVFGHYSPAALVPVPTMPSGYGRDGSIVHFIHTAPQRSRGSHIFHGTWAPVDTFCSHIASWRDIMALSKSRLEDRLPRQFPVGAKYVVEGYGGAEGQLRVSARYILLPGGQRINVSGGRASSSNRSRRSPALRVPFKIRSGTAAKNLTGRRGTAARASR